MKNILFIMGSYLPSASANGICCDAVMKKYIELGYNIYCIANQDEDMISNEIIDNIKVFRVKKYTFSSKPVIYIIKVLQKIANIITYPHTGNYSRIKRMYDLAERIVTENNIEMIVSVHKPIESLIVGNKLKNLYPHLIYVQYMLDSLSGGLGLHKYEFNKKLKYEKKMFLNADKIILMESSKKHIEKYYCNHEKFDNMIFLDIPLITEKNLNIQYNERAENKVHILFSGTILKDRNPIYILNIIKKLNRNDVVFEFAGTNHCNQIFENALKSWAGNKIIMLGFLNHNNLLPLLTNADMFLNMGNSMPSDITSKIFEYMSFRKPIISTYRINNDACIPYLKKYPNSLLLNENDGIDVSTEKLNTFINNYLENKVSRYIDKKTLLELFYKNTPEDFINNINNI